MKSTRFISQQTSVCSLTSSRHLSTLHQKLKQDHFSAGSQKKVTMQQRRQMGKRKILNLCAQNSDLSPSSYTNRRLPISNSKAYSLKARIPQNSINTIPNRPPKQAKVASNRVQLRSNCCIRSDFRRQMRASSSVLMTQKLLTTGRSLRVSPFSEIRSLKGSGQRLLSVLTSYSEKKICELTPTKSVNYKQLVSSRTQSRYCSQLASMMGLAKQMLNLNTF